MMHRRAMTESSQTIHRSTADEKALQREYISLESTH